MYCWHTWFLTILPRNYMITSFCEWEENPVIWLLCLRGIHRAIYLHTVSEGDTSRYISSYCVWEGYVALYIFILCLRGIRSAIYLHICVWEGYVALYIFILCLRGIRSAIYLHTVSERDTSRYISSYCVWEAYVTLYIFILCLRGIRRAIYLHTVYEGDT